MTPDQIDLTDTPTSADRRGLLRTAGLGAVALGAAAATTTVASSLARATSSTGPTALDTEILNFALNLEYLEAEFYLRATTGQGLQSDTGERGTNPGTVTGGSMVPFRTNRIRLAALDIAKDEHTHVQFLRSVLGSAAVDEPTIDFAKSFNTLAQAAGFATSFNPFADEESFLLGAYVFEDVGVTAYHGAAPLISAQSGYLSPAAGILAVEAYHAGEIRSLINNSANAHLAVYAGKISNLRATLSGGPRDDFGPITNGSFNIAPTDSNAIAFSRTTTQVLRIVYGGGAPSGYLFFPNRMNGAIR